MAYYLVKDFVHGLDTRRMIETTEPGSLIRGRNMVITRGGEIEKRKSFNKIRSLPEQSFGLFVEAIAEYIPESDDPSISQTPIQGGTYHVFGSTPGVGTAPGVAYHLARHHVMVPPQNEEDPPTWEPDDDPMVFVRAVRYFQNKLFLVAQFQSGSVQCFYGEEGPNVDNLEMVLVQEAGPIIDINTDNPDEDPVPEPDIYPVGGGRSFAETRLVKSTEDAEGQSDTRVKAIMAVRAYGGTGEFQEIFTHVIYREDLTADPVQELILLPTDTPAMATKKIADAINAFSPPTGSSNFHAKSDRGKIFIAFAEPGAGFNGFQLSVGSDNDGLWNVIPNPASFGGGVTRGGERPENPDGGQPQRLVKALPDNDAWTPGINALQYKNKMYTVGGYNGMLRSSAIGNPAEWAPESDGAWYRDHSTEGGRNAANLTSLGVFQSSLAVFASKAIYIWDVYSDPDRNSLRSVLHNTGTYAPKSVVEFGNTDIFYLDQTGIRSVQSRELSGEGFASDVGNPVDDLVRDAITDIGFLLEFTDGVIEPSDGRFILSMGNKMFVFSFYANTKIAAWSIWDVPFFCEDLVTDSARMYCRDRRNLYVYGKYPVEGAADDYDSDMEVEVQIPYLSAGKPATQKNFVGVDVALLNSWELEMGLDYSDEDLLEKVATSIGGTTYRQQRVFLQGYGTHVSFRLKHKGDGPAKIGNLAFHYTDGEQPG
jgi:hypothetical protein